MIRRRSNCNKEQELQFLNMVATKNIFVATIFLCLCQVEFLLTFQPQIWDPNTSFRCKKVNATMNENELTYYEQRLLREIKDVESRIRELRDERSALERLLANARGRDRVIGTVKRKNSVDRVLVESTVLEALTDSDAPLRSSELYRRVSSVVFSLNENTFRSYLHRMKLSGKIENFRGIRGRWAIPNQMKDE